MTQEESNQPERINIVPAKVVEEGFVQLPFNETQFKDFIRSLLGNPQTITKNFEGAFEIDKEDIRNLYYLICQRVAQQNEGVLAQFTAKIVYSDNSSVELNSIDDFMSYNEVRPIISRAVHLVWSFVVRFQDKQAIEKQRIQITFGASGDMPPAFDALYVVRLGRMQHETPGIISVRIEHTARTWGADIEALLTNHIQSLIKKPPKVKEFIRENSGRISFWISTLVIVAAFVGCFLAVNRIRSRQLTELSQMLQNIQGVDNLAISTKLDQISAFLASATWSSYPLALATILILSTVVAIAIGIWIDELIVSHDPSFILISKEAKKDRDETLKRLEARWRKSIFAVLLNLIVGIITNIIYAMWFG